MFDQLGHLCGRVARQRPSWVKAYGISSKNQVLLQIWVISPLWWGMVVVVLCSSVLLSGNDKEIELREGWMWPNTEWFLKKNLLQSTYFRLEQRFTFQHDNNLKHSALTMWLQDKSQNVLEWTQRTCRWQLSDSPHPVGRDWEDLPEQWEKVL